MAYSAFPSAGIGGGSGGGGGFVLPPEVTLKGNAFNAANELLNLDGSGHASPANLPTLDLIRAPAANLSLAGLKIVNLGSPTLANDAATKAYVDALITGQQLKTAVGNATTANITLSGEQTIDGVLTSTSRILVKDQTDSTQNGIYVTSAGAWTRATDADTGSELVNASVFVSAGTVNGSTSWGQITPTPITIGSSNIVWTQTGASTSISAGNGLNKVGSTLNALGTTNRIDVGTTIDISASYVGQSSITTLGTISSGVWNATTLGIGVGGTGATTANNALNNLLPSQGGNVGKQLQTDGTNASWQVNPGSLFVNVKASPFNAVGDGVTDDTTAINSALASMTSGGVCYMPTGTYKIGTGGTHLTFSANTRVMGDGKGATTLKLAGNLPNSSSGVFQGTSKNYWSIHDLTIDLNGFVGTGITPIQCNHWSIHNCEIINITNTNSDGLTNGYGVFVNAGQHWTIRNNYIHKAVSDGHFQNQSIIVSDSGGDVSYFDISNNKSVNTGILVQGHDGWISGNSVKGAGYGAGIATGGNNHSFRIIISDNNCSLCNPGVADRNATRLSGFQIWGSSHTIKGNVAYHNDQSGFSIICSNSAVIGNVAYDNGISINASGFTAIYSSSTDNANRTCFVGNRSYNTLGAAGTQNYGYEESNNILLVGVTQSGNNWDTNKLGTTKITSPNSGGNNADIVSSISWTPGSIANGAVVISPNVSMGLAAFGDTVLPAISVSLQGCSLSAGVSAANGVTATITNNTGSTKTFGALTLNIRVIKAVNALNY